MATVRVLIVDDQEPFREAAKLVVELADGFEIVGEATSGEEAVERVRELRPDLCSWTSRCRASMGSRPRARSARCPPPRGSW